MKNLRRIEIGDLVELRQVSKELAEVSTSGAYQWDWWDFQTLERAVLSDEGWGLWEVAQDSSLVGFVFLKPVAPDIQEILYLATRPTRRKMGYMAHLLRYVLERLSVGTRVWVEVHENNISAQDLYLKLGFKKNGRRPRYYRDGGAAIQYTYFR